MTTIDMEPRVLPLNGEQVNDLLETIGNMGMCPQEAAILMLYLYVRLCEEYRKDKPTREDIAASAARAIRSMEFFEGPPQ